MQFIMMILDFFGVAVFAISGTLAAGKKRMDLFGVVVLASATALGGGTLRDVIIANGPVFWVADPAYLLVATIVSVVTFFSIRYFDLPAGLLLKADAIGLAVFTVIGVDKALEAGISGGIAIVMGMMTGVFGGIIRDILSGESPLVFRREIYATASLCGAFVYWFIASLFNRMTVAIIISILVTLGIRLAAARWKLSLPLFRE